MVNVDQKTCIFASKSSARDASTRLRPASSAAVERLSSQVGIAFSAKRKSGKADTIADIMFARANLP